MENIISQEHCLVSGPLNASNIAAYHQYGFLVVNQVFSPAEIQQLRNETAKIFRAENGSIEGLQEILPGETDEEVLKKYVAIHFPHKLSPVIMDYLKHEKVAGILGGIVSPNVKAVQSILFVKGPGKAGQSWHQDEYFIPTRDKSLVGAWIAVDDASIGNGCLWVIPGSQNPAFIRERIPGNSDEYADTDTVDVSEFDESGPIPVEVKSGDVVFFNGYLLHSSKRNKTKDHFRIALVNHYMSAESMLPWDQDGRLPATTDMRDIVMVAGEDPYAYKGTRDLSLAFLRPEVLTFKRED